ncbi:MAG: precorrin-6x reductase [Oscillospiraceae bacterium]|nr:precorrin-6x reductase [Oscillospiraceae bacterium]
MSRLLLFAGTTEGRKLSLAAAELGYDVTVCVATEYGKAQFPDGFPGVISGRLETADMVTLIRQESFDSVIDATHPYAVAVSANVRDACDLTGVRCLRLLREESPAGDCVYFDSLSDACSAAEGRTGPILATTGSKVLQPYTTIRDYRNRVFFRVLPTQESMLLCLNAGIPARHIIAQKGPFSKECNLQLLHDIHAKTVITKDGGAEGGFAAKVEAARESGAEVFVIRRPRESGFTYQQVLSMLKEEF